jgi:uncharacterized protein (DUF302 family)
MLIEIESQKSIDEICAAMEPVVQKHKFGVMTVHNLRETMANKGVTFGRDCYIFEICNPHIAKSVLEAKPEVSSALPCRVSVFQSGEKVKIVTMKPTEMLGLFGVADLDPVAQEVEDTIRTIMQEVAD